ncbi:hypothetical protein T484DRAFT_3213575 [Baffinella frigidus]|nr:hypothetical protein T484DRAFT_3213575 [Cryptophyta sp. CCMP2293]
MVETPRVPARWVGCTERVDEVWVPTAWHLEVFAGAGVKREKLAVMPEAVDTALFDPALVAGEPRHPACPHQPKRQERSGAEAAPLARGVGSEVLSEKGEGGCERRVVFLSVFKWEQRKGWDVLLDAYWAAFSPSDAVTLRIRSFVPSWEIGPRDINERVKQHARTRGPQRLRAWRAGLGSGCLRPPLRYRARY